MARYNENLGITNLSRDLDDFVIMRFDFSLILCNMSSPRNGGTNERMENQTKKEENYAFLFVSNSCCRTYFVHVSMPLLTTTRRPRKKREKQKRRTREKQAARKRKTEGSGAKKERIPSGPSDPSLLRLQKRGEIGPSYLPNFFLYYLFCFLESLSRFDLSFYRVSF